MSEQLEYSFRNCNVICRVILYGTSFLVAAIAVLLVVSLIFNGNLHALSSLAVCGAAFFYMLGIYMLLRRKYHTVAAYLIILFYLLLASYIVFSWGINTPLGTLIFGLVIVLAGILLAAKHAFFAAIASGTILIGIQTAIIFHWYMPDASWTTSESSYGDVLAYCTVFGMLALVSWLYNREMQQSLAQARQAEAALRIQKATLETRVKKRTAQLRRTQLEEMQQMYRFAELGQLGVTLLHDLANYLTALSIEIEDIDSKQHSKTIVRARKIMQYLADIVYNTRERLHGTTHKQTFNIVQKTSETIAFLHDKAAEAHMEIDWHPPKHGWRYKGDAASFCQVIAIITSNAIDAYSASKSGKVFHYRDRKVVVLMERNDTDITIRISDWGMGIAKKERGNLFKPFHSTKKKGMGLGLYIAKQTVEMEFSGNLIINPRIPHTEFIIKLPLKNEA